MNPLAPEEQRKNNVGGITGKGFLPGQSGNPKGRPKGQSLTAILRALAREEVRPGVTVAEAISRRLLQLAMKGDRRAIRDVFDRLEGRPVQAIELSGPDEGAIPISLTSLPTSELESLGRIAERLVDGEPEGGPPSR